MKKIISAVLAVILIAGTLTIGSGAYGDKFIFTDVEESAYYGPAIKYMYELGIVSAYDDGYYYPKEEMRIPDLALMLYRIAASKGYDVSLKGKRDTILSAVEYADKTGWYAEALAWAVENGVIVSYTGEGLKITDKVTRGWLAVSCSLLLDLLGIKLAEAPLVDSFADADSFPSWAADHIEAMRKAGMIDAVSDGNFCPDNIMLKPQTVVHIYRFLPQLELAKPKTLPAQLPRITNTEKKFDDFDYYYEIKDDGTASILKYLGSQWDVSIPSKIKGCDVTEIGTEAFKENTELKIARYPSTLKVIGERAFFGCENLSDSVYSMNLEKIGAEAYYGCSLIKSPSLPRSVNYIGDNAYDIDNLEKIYYEGIAAKWEQVTFESTEYAKKLNEIIIVSGDDFIIETSYNGEYATIRGYIGTATDIVLPQTFKGVPVTGIIDGIKNNKILKSVIIPEGYTDIGDMAFVNCNNLEEVILPTTVKTIGIAAFENCTSLTKVNFPNGLETIGGNAFKNTGLVNVVLPKSITILELGAFSYCANLESIDIKCELQAIETMTVGNCPKLREVKLPKSVEVLGMEAFTGHNADSIVMPGVNLIDMDALKSDKNTFLFFGSNVPELTDSAEYPTNAIYFYRSGTSGWDKAPFGGKLRTVLFPDDASFNGWYRDSVAYVIVNGLMNGTSATQFEPNTTMTRAMLVTVLWRLDGSPAPKSSAPFGDLKQAWYKDAVAWAAENEIVLGVGGDRFDPNGNITREQMATILYRFSEYKGYDTAGRA
ncbi:MAG: leucine-rich repeat protein, partial [Clostridia bacterium]|nr:leucine-rich repeat protein [Clostridia bacterium]